jgi:hypothetical protein
LDEIEDEHAESCRGYGGLRALERLLAPVFEVVSESGERLLIAVGASARKPY